MHAVVVRVTIKDVEAAQRTLKDEIVPRVSQAPGFVAGYWTRKDSTGISMVVFESEEAASRMTEMLQSGAIVPENVELVDAEVREVVAHA